MASIHFSTDGLVTVKRHNFNQATVAHLEDKLSYLFYGLLGNAQARIGCSDADALLAAQGIDALIGDLLAGDADPGDVDEAEVARMIREVKDADA